MRTLSILSGIIIVFWLFNRFALKKDVKSIQIQQGNVRTQTESSMLYFGQKKPSTTPELFAPNIISIPDRHEFGSAFSRDGHEFYFGVDNNGISEIYYTKLEGSVWSLQEKLYENDTFSYNDPILSPDENRLFFISNRPIDSSTSKKDYDIWYAEKNKNGWSEHANLGPIINSTLNEYYISFTDNGTLYFASKDKSKDAPRYAYDIYQAKLHNGKYAAPQKLPEEINTDRYEADVFVAPDESYLIFCSIRKGGFGQGDLYISFRDDDGNWTPSVNMGNSINTENHELCPFVTRDGKYLFFTSNQDIYWVSAEVLKKYKRIDN